MTQCVFSCSTGHEDKQVDVDIQLKMCCLPGYLVFSFVSISRSMKAFYMMVDFVRHCGGLEICSVIKT